MRDTEYYYVVLYMDDDEYVIANDGGSGPMSTGTDEWVKRSGSSDFGNGMFDAKANEYAEKPWTVGYGGERFKNAGVRIVYQMQPVEDARYYNTYTDAEKELEKAKERAIKNLTAEERNLLGLDF